MKILAHVKSKIKHITLNSIENYHRSAKVALEIFFSKENFLLQETQTTHFNMFAARWI